jgi:hypothetical protein
MSRPCIPKNTADALRQQVCAARNRAEANALESSEPMQAQWRRLEANDMEDYAENFLALPGEEIEVGAAGEMVPNGERAMDRPDLIDTVRSQPDKVTARASVARLELVAQTSALDLAVDTADTIKARNSTEKMLAHQIAAAHALAMKFVAKSEQMLGFVTSWDTAVRQQVSSIEASRLANSAARMMESFNQGLLTLDRLRNGRRQVVTVQHVTVGPGGQATVTGEVSRRRGGNRK